MSRRLKHAVKVAIAYVLYYTGILALWQAVALRNRAVVLMYHRVLNADEQRATGSHPGIVVSRETFAKQMALLKRRFVPLSLDEFAARMERRQPFASSSCLVTFDDGWRDNYTHALPILREHGVPALVFLPVNFIGRRRLFWREALTHLLVSAAVQLQDAPARRRRVAALLAPLALERALDADGHDARAHVVDVISGTPLKAAAVEPVLAPLAAELAISLDELETPDQFMDWTEIDTMARSGVAFGGHGADHRLLTDVSPQEAEVEITASRQALGRFNGAVPTFSYPNGNWNPEVVDRVKRVGYRLAFTTVPGFVRCDDDRFTVKRLNIHESATGSAPMFLARVVGLF